jgi:hypothetical protein
VLRGLGAAALLKRTLRRKRGQTLLVSRTQQFYRA